MRKKYMLKISILAIVFILFCGIKNIYAAEGTLRMQVNNGTPWTNINISQSYEACENLNKSTSTLGTSLLQAHLTTDEDWSAMAILSVSQYGGATNNNPSTTTGNGSGIYNIGMYPTQTTGFSSTANQSTNIFVSGLFNEDGTTKKYVKTWNLADREGNNYVGFKNNGTYGWYGAWTWWGNSNSYPVSIKSGLFGVLFGRNNYYCASGAPYNNVTFRPVIWN